MLCISTSFRVLVCQNISVIVFNLLIINNFSRRLLLWKYRRIGVQSRDSSTRWLSLFMKLNQTFIWRLAGLRFMPSVKRKPAGMTSCRNENFYRLDPWIPNNSTTGSNHLNTFLDLHFRMLCAHESWSKYTTIIF